ncbi:exodeoxyribonuclease V subunit gamma [Immundisolibacter sp.]|uniref:exodeoxyribonuclease V subunit gamma n=1 Tax=Immundisolibacter sp. TaxID=1934948 RepID=UPI00261EFA06|nr:exodeoxyribonuclease V subunit gamma [Immundisolibacter sp.]MDD3652304.1 exodeoxyribonuclease V subunit gamma [Immundisolibacter sp.]
MLHVHHSNRLERLADRLCELIAVPAGPALAPETLVVPNAGMARWLSLAVAQRLGVAANLDCVFPASFVWRVLRAQEPSLPALAPAEQGPLLFGLLAAFAAPDRPAEIDRYLADDDGLKAWQLARRLADCYERYQLFRPDWLAAWEAGADAGWDAQLWRTLAAGRPHQGRLLLDLLGRARAGRLVTIGLPGRLSVFGLSALAPAYLALLQALAVRGEVHLYVPDPCAAYWHELTTPRVQARRRRWAQQTVRAEDLADAAAGGHPLLAAWGQAGRAFAAQLLDCAAHETEDYDDPGDATLLRRLQRDLLLLEPPQPAAVAPGDRSIEIHVCHSRLREVQVLHDRLLGLFEAHPDLSPRDCVVMAPDIDAYAPHITAVFDSAPAGRRIPYAIADRAPRAERALAAAFLDLLDLPQSRLPASQVLSLLELPALCRAFGIADASLPRLRALVQQSGARFAFDAAARAELGLPPSDEHTWRGGLDRLLLGHASSQPLGDLLPLPLADSELAQAAGGFAELLRRLRGLQRELAGPHLPAEWTPRLLAALALFEPGDEDEADTLALLRGAVLRLEAEAQAGAGAAPLARAAVKGYLSGALDEPGPARSFITGALTCCRLAPMRAIPFRVVCVLGLNDGEFPRRARPAEFDRLAGDYRPGDRVPRDEDRYLLLEALLAARDTLHLSYVGRRQADNAPLPPSALITELLDVLRQMSDTGAPVIVHPLQAFSARYGREPDLVTYAGEWFERAPPAPVFAAQPLSPADPDGWTLDDLLDFVRSPARWFLRGRLGLRLGKLDEAPADDEPFYLAGLDAYAVGQQLVQAHLAGRTADDTYRALRAQGALPAAAAGRRLFDQAWADAGALAARAAPLLAQPQPDRLVELDIAGTVLTGRLRGLTAAGLVDCQYSKNANGPRVLSLWVRHLAVNAAGLAVESHLFTREQTVRLAPVQNAAATLADLVALARQGLCEPLPLLPKSALAYAAANEPDRGLQAAWSEWNGNSFQGTAGERDDPDLQVAFRGREPLQEPAFAELAMRVFGPLLAAWVRS